LPLRYRAWRAAHAGLCAGIPARTGATARRPSTSHTYLLPARSAGLPFYRACILDTLRCHCCSCARACAHRAAPTWLLACLHRTPSVYVTFSARRGMHVAHGYAAPHIPMAFVAPHFTPRTLPPLRTAHACCLPAATAYRYAQPATPRVAHRTADAPLTRELQVTARARLPDGLRAVYGNGAGLYPLAGSFNMPRAGLFMRGCHTPASCARTLPMHLFTDAPFCNAHALYRTTLRHTWL